MSDAGRRIIQVDAFTWEPFRGNPAAVCPLDGPADGTWMQDVAREMNLSETAFVWPEAEGFRLRWFTPTVEVDLCGHATLAAAHVLWEEGLLDRSSPALFLTLSGALRAELAGDEIRMDFPAEPPAATEAPPQLASALRLGGVPSASSVAAGAAATDGPVRFVGRSRSDLFVELDSETRVRSLRPDRTKLEAMEARGVIVTAPADSAEIDVVSRFFAPRVGVDEDPVTGSAHCSIGPFWGDRLGRRELTCYQASPRGGMVRVELRHERVVLAGRAVTVLRGELCVR